MFKFFRSTTIPFFLAFAFVVSAHANTPPVIDADIQVQQHFTSLESAAIAGLTSANKHFGVEYGGVVYKIGDKYYFTNPITQNDNQQVQFAVRLHHGAKIVALFHTHPSAQDSDEFSAMDIKVANALNVPSYIAVQESGEILVYKPGDPTSTEMVGGEPDVLYAMGHFVCDLSDTSENRLCPIVANSKTS